MKMIRELLSEELHPRVVSGSEAQIEVHNQLLDEYGDEYELLSIAPKGSQAPDLVANIQGHKVQLEIKTREIFSSVVTLYDKSVGREQPDKLIDTISYIMSNGDTVNFVQFVEQMNDPEFRARFTKTPTKRKVGFPGDIGVTKSGSVWASSKNPYHTSKIRLYLINLLRKSGNNYLVFYDQREHSLSYYHTGLGPNILNVDKIPNLTTVIMDTGGGNKTKKIMRVGIKVKFAL